MRTARWLAFLLAIPASIVLPASYAEVVGGVSGLQLFDPQRAEALTAERRRQYDVVFFNEIEIWNLSGNRYTTSASPTSNEIFEKRSAEFTSMASDGYLPAYVALRLADLTRGELHSDPEALDLLIGAAEAGDLSAMCALVAMPIAPGAWRQRDGRQVSRGFLLQGAQKGHGACMAYYGGALLLGDVPDIPQDRDAAMPLLLAAAEQGYYVAARRLFYLRQLKVYEHKLDFADTAEVDRALCWGRLSEQQTNWTGFRSFLGDLRSYARENSRPELTAKSDRLDPRRVPISEKAVVPADCIRLERGD